MDAVADLPSPPARRWRHVGAIAAALALLAYGGWLWANAGVVAGGSDSSGYFSLARNLLAGRISAPARMLAGAGSVGLDTDAHAPLGFTAVPGEPRLIPTYPTGLPLMFAAGSAVAGWWHGPTLVIVLHAIAGILLTYACGRAFGLSPPLSALGAIILAACPLYVLYGLQAMSDLPALVWATAAVLLAWQGRDRPALSIAAGMALGMAVLVRPSNVLASLPVVLALGRPGRAWIGLCLGGLPFAAWFAAFNDAAYGSPLSTGYGGIGGMLEARWFAPALVHYGTWLPVLLSPVIVLAPGLPVLRDLPARGRLVLGSWMVAFPLFYAFYFHTHETWWYLRFILPSFPALVVAALLVAQGLMAVRPAFATRSAAALLAVAVLASSAWWIGRWGVAGTGRGETIYPRAARAAGDHLPPDAVTLAMQASGALFFYTDRTILRWDYMKSHWPAVRAAATRDGRPVCAVLFDFEVQPALEEFIPGRWTKVHQLSQVSYWRLEPDSSP